MIFAHQKSCTAGTTFRVFLHTLSPLVINFLALLQKMFSLLQKSMILRSAVAEISAIALFVEALREIGYGRSWAAGWDVSQIGHRRGNGAMAAPTVAPRRVSPV